METDQNYDILIRRLAEYSVTENMYRITVFKRLKSMDDLLMHREIAPLIEGQVIRMEKIDNFRFKIFVRK
jgi:hypothetical protein